MRDSELREAAQASNLIFRCFISFIDEPVRDARGQLAGCVVGIKDCIDVAGVRGTWGSGVHRNRVAEADAAVVTLLRASGAVLLGTTNLHEFAFGGTSQNPHYGSCRNAWSPDKVPGGSSGGSAVAVALGLCDLGIGTDTGASTRMPASLNGVIGLRPTHGAVSSVGVMPVSPPHDTVGFLARDIETLRRAVAATYEVDPRDPFSRPNGCGPTPREPRGLRVGILSALLDRADPAIVESFRHAANETSALASTTVEVFASEFRDVADHLAPIVIADAAAFHEQRLRTSSEEIGAAVHQRIGRGLTMSAVEYARHIRWLEGFKLLVSKTFRELDVLIAPTVHISPPSIAEAEDAVQHTASLSRNCWAAPAAGLPALSLPCGLDSHGVPIGLQLIGKPWSDLELLDLAERLQGRLPKLGTPKDFVDSAPWMR